MNSWFSTSKLLKTISFILLVILTICIACPNRQAIADDGNYPDHENNIPPYVHSIIALFDNSPTTGHCTVQDVEFWSNGNSIGYADNLYNISVPSTADCIDFDIQIPIAAPSGNSVICLFNLYALGITNVDYIEFYKQTSYEAVPVYYYTYYSNQFYWITSGQNISASAYYTLRIHIKQGGYSITRYNYANTVTLKSYEPANNSSFQEQYTQWYYLTSLLREVDGLGISVESLSIDFTSIQSAINDIYTLLRSERYGNNAYIYYDESFTDPVIRIYDLDNNYSAVTYHDYYVNSTYQQLLSNSKSLYIAKLDWSNASSLRYFNVRIPLYNTSFNNQFYDYKFYVAFYPDLNYNNTRRNSILSSNNSYFSTYYVSYDSNEPNLVFLNVFVYFPNIYAIPYANSSPYMYLIIDNGTENTGNRFYVRTAPNKGSIFSWVLNSVSQVGFENTTLIYLDHFYQLLHSIADNTQYVAPPAGSDPVTNITNIYDIDVEFNNTVGDISLFESNYQQQLSTYDTQISSNYLIPVSDQYTFTSLNSEFQYLWDHMFSYDLDENNNKIGVYGLGLYFLIPIVLFVICALFRRVTS